MRRTLLGLAAATVALTAVPALAVDEPVEPALLPACAGVADADRVVLGERTTAVAAPLTPSPTLAAAPLPRTTPDTTRTFVVDLAGQPEGTLATFGTVLTWGQSVNDFDLRVTSGEDVALSQEVNPTTMQAREEAGLAGLAHCATVTVSVHNYLAAPESLSLALKAAVEEAVGEE